MLLWVAVACAGRAWTQPLSSTASHPHGDLSHDEWLAESGWPERLLRVADSLRLDKDPAWLKLLHYHRHFGRLQSDIDGGYFFLAREGKTDSRAELHATLKALLSESDLSPPLPKGLEVAAMHPLCKFRARLRFLQSRLIFPDSILPDVDCNRWETWRDALHPTGATLIFASSYLNNPASTFGHTFLRLNTYAGASEKSLLNYGITYAANVPPGDNLLFVFKGVFGAYHGAYGIVPYFVSLQKYSHLESRDIWEYELAMDSTQISTLLEHVWELGACWMDYYFFDENCSYNIFTLLDAALPGAGLVNELDPSAIVPAETVKLLVKHRGLVKDVRWRPSLLTDFRLRTARMTGAERGVLQRLVKQRNADTLAEFKSGFGADTTAALMDVALDYLQYRKRREEKDGKPGVWSDRQRRLLMARSGFPPKSGLYPTVRDLQVTPPEAGHAAHALRLSAGSEDFRPYLDLGLRFAYHDVNADEAGFLRGSEIEALQAVVRIKCRGYCDEAREGGNGGMGSRAASRLNGVVLERADLLNLLSATTADFMRVPISWSARLGYDTRPSGAVHGGGWMTVAGGPGVAISGALAEEADGSAWVRSLLFGLAEIKTRESADRLTDFEAGPQARLGWRLSWGEHFSLFGKATAFFALAGDGKWEREAGCEARVSLGRNADLRLGLLNRDGVGDMSVSWWDYF